MVLVFNSCYPTLWQVGRTKNTKFAVAWLTGGSRQEILGLPNDIPVLNTSEESPVCARGNGYTLPKIVHDQSSSNPKAMLEVHTDGRVVFNPHNESVTWQEPQGSLKDLILGEDELPQGEDGIAYLAKTHQAYSLSNNEADCFFGIINADEKDRPLRNTLLLLENVKLPESMYGGHLGVFYLPDSVDFPKGNPAHSRFVLLSRYCVVGHC